jgi:hypothetical protein
MQRTLVVVVVVIDRGTVLPSSPHSSHSRWIAIISFCIEQRRKKGTTFALDRHPSSAFGTTNHSALPPTSCASAETQNRVSDHNHTVSHGREKKSQANHANSEGVGLHRIAVAGTFTTVVVSAANYYCHCLKYTFLQIPCPPHTCTHSDTEERVDRRTTFVVVNLCVRGASTPPSIETTCHCQTRRARPPVPNSQPHCERAWSLGDSPFANFGI